MNNYYASMNQIFSRCIDAKIPCSVAFELTSRCNFNCKMCYVHTSDPVLALKEELSTQQWKDIMDQAYDQGMLYALLTGGECLLRKDFKELYLHLWNKGVNISVNSNGYLIDDDYIAFFKEHNLRKLQITLYGSCEEAYESVTGVRAYDRICKTLGKIRAAGIHLVVAVTPNKFSAFDFPNLIQYLKDNDYNYTISEVLFNPQEGVARDDFSWSVDDLIPLLCERARIHGKNLTPVQIEECPSPTGNSELPAQKVRCNAGRCHYSVSWRGKMLPCIALSSFSLDILSLGVKAAWQQINALVETLSLPKECSGCAYNKVCSPCLAVRSSDFLTGELNKECCELAVKKCVAGLRSI